MKKKRKNKHKRLKEQKFKEKLEKETDQSKMEENKNLIRNIMKPKEEIKKTEINTIKMSIQIPTQLEKYVLIIALFCLFFIKWYEIFDFVDMKKLLL